MILTAAAVAAIAAPSLAAGWIDQGRTPPASSYDEANRTLVFACDDTDHLVANLLIPGRELPDDLRGGALVQLVFAKDENMAGQVVADASVATVDGRIELTVTDSATAKAAIDLGLQASQHLDVGMAQRGSSAVTPAMTVPVVGLGAAIESVAAQCGNAAAGPVGPAGWTTGNSASGAAPSEPAPMGAETSSEPSPSIAGDESDGGDDMDDPDDEQTTEPIAPYREDAWTLMVDGAQDWSAGIASKDGTVLDALCIGNGQLALEYVIPHGSLDPALTNLHQVTFVVQFDGAPKVSFSTVSMTDSGDYAAAVVGSPAANDWIKAISNADQAVDVGLVVGAMKKGFAPHNAVSFPAKNSAKAISDLRAKCK